MKEVYADFAAATPTDPRVVKAMTPFLTDDFGNPSSAHQYGQAAAGAIDEASRQIAGFLNCQPNEIFYTSGGTESNNLAIIGVAKANKNRGQHIITTAIEHPSILNACKALEKDGWAVTYLPVDKNGLVVTSVLQKALKPETVLVSIHLANSEIGVIQNVAELARVTKEIGAYFHTDACQAAAFIDLNVQKLGIDLLTFNGAKMYGPKGSAVLYVKEGTEIFPILYGGGQQNSLRSGTENVPGIIGLAKATEIAQSQRQEDSQRIGQLRDQLQKDLENMSGVSINAIESLRLPNHLSVTFGQIKETNLVEFFDQRGIALSSGSACSANSVVDSHVLQAIGLSGEQIHRTVRISLGRSTATSNISQIIEVSKKV